jgi:hypothetical protein
MHTSPLDVFTSSPQHAAAPKSPNDATRGIAADRAYGGG